MRKFFRQVTAYNAIWLACWPTFAAQQTGTESQLKVVVVQGQGAINNVRSRTSNEIIVRVEDESQQPVAGASVAFTLPSQGPSGSFVNGEQTLVLTTDNMGTAVARGLTPNRVEGKMEIRITASHQGKTSSAVITQFNMAVQNPKSGGSGKWIAILVAAGAAGAAGAVLGTRNGSSPSSPSTPTGPPVISISAGSGSVGPPQ